MQISIKNVNLSYKFRNIRFIYLEVVYFFITISTGNACCHSVQNLLPPSLIYRTIILPVAVYGCEGWLLKLREEHWLRLCENMLLRRMFELKRDEVIGGVDNTT
jgi:hypothetical protein